MAWRGPPQGRGAAVVATAGQARDRTRGVWGVQFDLCVCVMRESTSARWSLETSDETCGELESARTSQRDRDRERVLRLT